MQLPGLPPCDTEADVVVLAAPRTGEKTMSRIGTFSIATIISLALATLTGAALARAPSNAIYGYDPQQI